MDLTKNGNAQIKAKLRSCIPSWKQYGDQQIQLQRMNGITNETYKAWTKQYESKPLFIRKLSPSSENIFLSRQFEMQNYKCIEKASIAPNILYCDEFFRVQEFIQSSILPDRQEKEIEKRRLRQIAFNIRKFHNLKPQHLSSQMDISMFEKKIIYNQTHIIKNASKILSFQPSSVFEKQLIEKFNQFISQKQFQFLKELIRKQENRLVFSHNDLIRYNILVESQTNRLRLIDYEYSSYNYQIYDLAYYLNEAAFNYDHNQFPYFSYHQSSKEVEGEREYQFIRAYVCAKECTQEELSTKMEEIMKKTENTREFQRLIQLLPFGKLLVNFVWTIWRLLEGRFPKFNIDFVSFLNIRHNLYCKYKRELGY